MGLNSLENNSAEKCKGHFMVMKEFKENSAEILQDDSLWTISLEYLWDSLAFWGNSGGIIPA